MDKEKTSIQVIDRMMQLLDALAREPGAASLKTLAQATGLHPSTAHRILAVMVEGRLVDRVDTGSYQLGIRLLELGNVVRSRLSVRGAALPHMQALQQSLGESVNLSIPRGDEIVYVERVLGSKGMMRVVQVDGVRAPLHVTSAGKLFLATWEPAAIHGYALRTGLKRYTGSTITDEAALVKEVLEAGQRGYAFDREEAEKGVSCIGAGIRDDEGRLVAALSVSAPTERFDKAWAAQVVAAADKISLAMGYRG